MLVSSVTSVSAETNEMVSKGDYVNIRKGATTSYEAVGQLLKGSVVTKTDEFTNSQGELWYRIKFGSIEGWVLASFLETQSNADQQEYTAKDVYAKTNNIAIRKGATIAYPSISTISINEKLHAFDRYVNSTGEAWLRVTTPSNVTGWVQERLVSESKTDTYIGKTLYANKADIPLRKGATSQYAVVKLLALNSPTVILDQFVNASNEKWYKVDVNGTQGWILSDHVSVTAQQNIEKSMYINTANTTVHKGASTSYVSIATLTLNEQVKVVDEFTNSLNEQWNRVQINSSTYGWVKSQYLIDTPKELNNIYISIDGATIRSGASTSYKSLTSLSKGTLLQSLDTFTNSAGEVWYRVEFAANQFGWVRSDMTSTQPIPMNEVKYVGTRGANLHRGASFQYDVRTKLAYGEKVTIQQEFINAYDQKWVSIKTSSGITGWTPSWEVYSTATGASTVYNASKTGLRKGASTSYPISIQLSAGTPLLKLWSFNDWYNVEMPNGTRGWILKNEVSNVSPKALLNPAVSMVNSTTHNVSWEKAAPITLDYSLPSSNQIKIVGGLTNIELPSSVAGITSTTSVTNSDGTKSLLITLDSSYTFTLRNYENSLNIKIMKKGLAGKKIIVDAGHGDYDPGAIGPNKTREKDVNLAVAKYLKQELEANGATVLLTRSTDIFLELSERTNISNASDYDAFISIHSNAFNETSRGTQTFYNSSVSFNGPQSKLMAKDVQASLTQQVGTYNRGYTEQNFYVNRMNELPSALVELAYISNPNEEKLLASDTFRRSAALGIRKGLQNFFQ